MIVRRDAAPVNVMSVKVARPLSSVVAVNLASCCVVCAVMTTPDWPTALSDVSYKAMTGAVARLQTPVDVLALGPAAAVTICKAVGVPGASSVGDASLVVAPGMPRLFDGL